MKLFTGTNEKNGVELIPSKSYTSKCIRNECKNEKCSNKRRDSSAYCQKCSDKNNK